MVSETSKYRARVLPYCVGNGVDLGSGGDPIRPEALSLDLPPDAAARYTTTDYGHIQWRGDARDLYWFREGVLDYVYASHILEDFADWKAVLAEWARVVRPGGHLIILVPDQKLWATAVAAGQPCNHNHAREFEPGEVAAALKALGGWKILEDTWADPSQVTEVGTPDYSLLTVAMKR